MMRFSRRLVIAAVAVATIGLGMGSPAHAAFKLRFTSGSQQVFVQDNVTTSLAADQRADQSTGTSKVGVIRFDDPAADFSGLEIDLKGESNRTKLPTPLAGELSNIVVTLTNNSAVAKTITIELTDTGYEFPNVPPGTILSSFSGTLTDTTTDPATKGINTSVAFQAYADDQNGEFQTTSATPGALTFAGSSTGTTLDVGSHKNGIAYSGSRPYSLYSIFTITLGAGDTLNIKGTTQMLAPEPGTLALAFSTLPLFGLGAWMRRRKSQA